MSVEKRHPSLKTEENSVLGVKKGRFGVQKVIFWVFLSRNEGLEACKAVFLWVIWKSSIFISLKYEEGAANSLDESLTSSAIR